MRSTRPLLNDLAKGLNCLPSVRDAADCWSSFHFLQCAAVYSSILAWEKHWNYTYTISIDSFTRIDIAILRRILLMWLFSVRMVLPITNAPCCIAQSLASLSHLRKRGTAPPFLALAPWRVGWLYHVTSLRLLVSIPTILFPSLLVLVITMNHLPALGSLAPLAQPSVPKVRWASPQFHYHQLDVIHGSALTVKWQFLFRAGSEIDSCIPFLSKSWFPLLSLSGRKLSIDLSIYVSFLSQSACLRT